ARMTATLDKATSLVQSEAQAHAKASAQQASLTGMVAVGGSVLTLLAVAGISIGVILGIKKAIIGIAGATETLAGGDHRLDLVALARRDE
ncbi:hypothetical protein, partial [Priestia megaterium]|uniref:hypothetical protein n=1 Tax=Priestia megaterium TaxID=1404 RepID=UPI0035B58792